MGKKGNKFKKLYLRGESTHSIANKFGISHNTVLYHLKKLGIKRRAKKGAAKLGVARGRISIKRHIIPTSSQKLTLEKAYILGAIAGDGWIWYSNDKRAYQIGLEATDKDFAKYFFNSLHKTYKIRPSFKRRKRNVVGWSDLYSIKLCSKEACLDLLRYGKSFKTKRWRVPLTIKKASLAIKSKYLTGFFDSEGSVDMYSKRVILTSSNLSGLKEIKSLLESFSIKSRILKQTRAYNLRIEDKYSIRIFRDRINSTIKRKARRLQKLC